MRNWNYFAIYPHATRTRSLPANDLHKFIEQIHAYGQNAQPLQPTMPAGYTYFGQLIDHDLSFLRQTENAPDYPPQLRIDQLWQARKPALDLDTYYGAGLDDSTVPYERRTGKFVLGETLQTQSPATTFGPPQALKRDLPRDAKGHPLIADVRNDQHLLISQMQVLWMCFHNKLIDHFRALGYSGAERLFELAQKEVVNTYQYLVIEDFCRKIIPPRVYNHVLIGGEGCLTQPDKNSPELAIEFAAAAFRLHSFVKNTYMTSITNTKVITKNLDQLFELTGKRQMKQFFLKPVDVVDWRLFFGERQDTINTANPLSTKVVPFNMTNTEKPVMMELTTRRGLQLGIPSGQELCCHLENEYPATARNIGLKKLDLTFTGADPTNPAFNQTPLWIYLMLEPRRTVTNPHYFGPLGAWIVADTLRSARLSTAEKYLGWALSESVLFNYANRGGASSRRPSFIDLINYTYH